jgi:hypothetical protein
MRMWIAILAMSVAAVFSVLAGTASADQSQAGCQAYGAFVADTAQTLKGPQTPGGAGQFVSGIATSGPGAVAGTATFLKTLTCS